MNSVRHIFLIATALFVLIFWPASQARAQASTVDELNKRVTELFRVGKFAEAIPFAQQVLAITEKALGPDDPNVATTLNNLALLCNNQRRYADAEPLFKRSLAIREKALGLDDLNVATTLNNLAELYDNQGRYAEAEPLFKRSGTTQRSGRRRSGRFAKVSHALQHDRRAANTKTAEAVSLEVHLFVYSGGFESCGLTFLRRATRPNTPRPAAKSGRAAGSGVSAALPTLALTTMP